MKKPHGNKGHIPWNKDKKGLQQAWNKGKKASPETRKKLSDAAKRRKPREIGVFHHSAETKVKMSKAKKGKFVPWNKGMKGQWTISEAHRQALIKANIGNTYCKGKKASAETRKKLSDIHKGRIPANKGKHHTLETRLKIKEGVKRSHNTEEVKTKLRDARKGRTPNKGHHHTEEAKRKISDGCPWKGKHLSEEVRKHMSEGCKKKRGLGKWQTEPTKPELRIIKLIQKYNLPFIYTGLRKSLKEYHVVENLRCMPDFIAIDKKIAIEAFGRFWHTNSKYLPDIEAKDERKRKHFEKVGWQRLVFWDDEMLKMEDEEITNKILEQYNNQQYREINQNVN